MEQVKRLADRSVDLTDPLVDHLRFLHGTASSLEPGMPEHQAAVGEMVRYCLDIGWWEQWLTLVAPQYTPSAPASFHYDLWDWALGIGTDRPNPMVACWFRGASKTTSLQLILLMIACRQLRNYGLYLGARQRQAADKVAAIGELLMSPMVALAYPEVAQVYKTATGQRRDYRAARIRTASNFTLDAFGMDQAFRGVKVDEYRPGVIVLDDIEEYHDTPYMTQKRIEVLTRSIIPAAAPNALIVFVQNKIHDDSIMARLIDGRADFLADRFMSGPVPQIVDMETEEYAAPDGRVLHRIVGGTPTWPEAAGLKVSNQQLLGSSLVAFRSEKQHETDVVEGTKFPRDMWRSCPAAPSGLRLIRAWDLAATEGDGDWTVGALLGVNDKGQWWVLDVVRGQWGDARVEEIARDTIESDVAAYGRGKYRAVLEAQPGAAGKAWNRRWKTETLIGLPAELVPPQGSKKFRADGWGATQQEGMVTLVDDSDRTEASQWNRVLVREHAEFPDFGKHDDIVDACALGFNELARGKRHRARVASSAHRQI